MKSAIWSQIVIAFLFLSCTSAAQRPWQLELAAPGAVVVGETFHVAVTLKNSGTPTAVDRRRAMVIVESATCRVSFGVQRFDEIGGSRAREADTVWIPVVVSSQDAARGPVSLRARYERVDSDAHALTVQQPATEAVQQHARNLSRCREPADCLREIEYFRYVTSAEAADRLAELLPSYAFAPAAGEAVFAQNRRTDAASLRKAAQAPNANAERLLDLAERLEAGNACPGDL